MDYKRKWIDTARYGVPADATFPTRSRPLAPACTVAFAVGRGRRRCRSEAFIELPDTQSPRQRGGGGGVQKARP